MVNENVTKKNVLIMVDLQNDFCPGGRLAVPDGDAVIAIANDLQTHFDFIIATQDWHPRDHMSFAVNQPGCAVGDIIKVDGIDQVLWPVHCVQDTMGAALHPDLHTEKIKKIFHKGVDCNLDSYSAFYDNEHMRSTGLGEYLRNVGINNLYIMGLATDYCVKYSTLDALHLGFTVHVIADACRGIDLKPGDVDRAIQEMQKAGAKIVCIQDIFSAT